MSAIAALHHEHELASYPGCLWKISLQCCPELVGVHCGKVARIISAVAMRVYKSRTASMPGHRPVCPEVTSPEVTSAGGEV